MLSSLHKFILYSKIGYRKLIVSILNVFKLQLNTFGKLIRIPKESFCTLTTRKINVNNLKRFYL